MKAKSWTAMVTGKSSRSPWPARMQSSAPVLARTTWSKPVYEQAARKMVETGGGTLSHPVGLAVHDDGPYNRGPLKVGQVFSIDPQLWVPEETLYIRYEDVIAITPDGYENFTEFLPTSLDDLERLVGKGGIGLQVQPAANPTRP